MTISQFNEFCTKIGHLVQDHSNRMALDLMRRTAADEDSLRNMLECIDTLEQRYYYMLRFIGGDSSCGDATAELTAFETELKELLQQMDIAFCTASDPSAYYAQLRYQQRRPEETFESLLADYIEESKRLATDPKALTDTRCRSTIERLANDIFMRIWTAPALTEDTVALLDNILADDGIQDYDRELWLHAVGMGAVCDERRARLLAQYAAGGNVRFAAAAIMWLTMAHMEAAVKGVPIPESIKTAVDRFASAHKDVFLAFILDYLKCVVHKPSPENESLMRELGRMGAGVADRLANSSSTDTEQSIDRAMADIPEGYFEKMRLFNEAQQRGDDVFASTIGRMRHFPFFRDLPAWFMPFHLEHSQLAPVVDSEGVGMASILEKMPMLCDSDKFALVLSMAAAPEGMRSAMLSGSYSFISQMEATGEGSEVLDALNAGISINAALRNAVKNMARFVNSCRIAPEMELPVSEDAVLRLLQCVYVNDYPAELADFAISAANYGFVQLASEIFAMLADTITDSGMLAKSAQVFEAAGHMETALARYRQAISAGDTSIDTVMRAVRLILDDPYYFHELADKPSPMHMLEPFVASQASNADFLRLFARACMACGDYHRATETYFNLDYVLPEGDMSAKGELALALLHCGENDEAAGVLGDLPGLDKDLELSVTYAVALWLAGERHKAVEALCTALPATGGKAGKIRELISRRSSDIGYATDNGNNTDSLCLLAEIMDYRINGSRFGNLR